MTIRTAQLDADNRREPKTECYCVRCNKDLKPGQPRRYVAIADSAFAEVIHPDDVVKFLNGPDAGGYMGRHPVGMDCAKKIGLNFTIEGA